MTLQLPRTSRTPYRRAMSALVLLWIMAWLLPAQSMAASGSTVEPEAMPAALQQALAESLSRGGGGDWVQQGRLLASDGALGDRLGLSVALSGDTAVVGANFADVGGNDEQGTAYIFVRSAGAWTEQAKLTASDGAASDHFGWSVALSGDTALIAAPDADPDGTFNQGAAYVFTRSEGVWSEQARLTASDGASNEQLGRSVALSGDTALAGAYFASVDGNFRQGAAYVFINNGGVWSEQARLVASDGAANERFGSATALSGDTALVTAQTAAVDGNSLQGAAYVFTRSGGDWSEEAKLTASDGAAFDQLGNAAVLAGDTALVGAAFAAVNGNFQQGAAYVFVNDGGVWSEQAKLVASDGDGSDVFGSSVALLSDRAVIGARSADVGGVARGAVYVFARSGEVWTAQDRLTAENPSGVGDFGWSVALSETTLLVGSPGDLLEGTSSNRGTVHVFFDLPPDYATIEGIVLSLGYCGDRVVPLKGAALEVTGVNQTYLPVSGDQGFYRLLLPADESPVDIAVTAPGHLPFTVENVPLTAGEVVVQDFDVDLDAPCSQADPASFLMTLLPDDTAMETLTIGNLGAIALDWSVVEDEPLAPGLRRPIRAVTPVPVSEPGEHGGTGEWGASGIEGLLEVDPRSLELSGGPVTLTHSLSLDVLGGNSIACQTPGGNPTTPQNSFLRQFTLSDFGITDDFAISEVAFGIDSLSIPATIGVHLYTLEGDFLLANLTPIAEKTVLLPPQQTTLVQVPVSATAPAGSTVVLEIRAPDMVNLGAFYPGSNSAGQTSPSYTVAPSCGNQQPTTYSSLGFPQVQLVMTVSGATPRCGAEWLTLGPEAGSVGPGGSEPVDVTVSSSGLQTGEHHTRICLETNDPERPELVVPVSLEVVIPPAFGVVEGTVEGLGSCAAHPGPVPGASVVVESQQGTYSVPVDGDGFYRLGLDPVEGPVAITAAAPEHTSASITGITLVAGETAVHDFGLRLEQACATAAPEALAVELPAGASGTVDLTIGNVDGDATLEWSIETADPTATGAMPASGGSPATGPDRRGPRPGAASGEPETTPADWASLLDEPLPSVRPLVRAGDVVDCDGAPGLLVNDDGTVEQAYSGNVANGVSEVVFVDRFTPGFHPYSVEAVCLAFATQAGGPTSVEIEVVIYDDDGPDGRPGSELGVLAATVTDIPVWPISAPVWSAFDLSALGVTVPDGSFYVGARWPTSTPNVFVAANQSFGQPVGFAGGHWWHDQDIVWAPIQGTFTQYRALFVRPVVDGAVDCSSPASISWLGVAPISGSAPSGSGSTVEVSLDTTGLAPGTHEAGLCIATDDPANPLLAVPVSLTVVEGSAPVIDVDPDNLSATLQPDQMETQPLTIANLGDATLDWEVAEAVDTFERIGAIELEVDENAAFTAAIDHAGEFAYFATNTVPGRVMKIDLATFERVGALVLEAGENQVRSALIDPAGEFAYFGTGQAPGRVVKVDLATFQRIDAITLQSGENALRSAVIDPAGEFAYFGTGTPPGQVVKIDLTTFQRVGAITMADGEIFLDNAVIDLAGDFAYFATNTNPGRLIKIDLETFQRVGAVVLESNENALGSAAIDPAGELVYVGTGIAPLRVVKIDLDTFQRVDAFTVEDGQDQLSSAVIDPTGRFAYFGTGGDPAWLVKVDLETFERVGAISMESGENVLSSAVIDPAGEAAYFGTFNSPAKVVKVGLRGDCTLPDWLSADPASGSIPGGSNQVVDVTFDATGLELGEHAADLCLASNDPLNPLIAVPVSLTVTGEGPQQDAKLTASDGLPGDHMGRAVDIDGDTAIAGVEFRDVGGNSNQGVAYVFVRDGEEWVEQAMLVASDGAQFDQFGFSVAVSGDTALIGTASDVVYVFTRDGETWSEQAQLTADDTVPDDDFGLAVALDGDTALIGARAADVDGNTNQGAVYAFVGSGDTWNQQAKLVASDGLPFDLFGISVALDGDTAAIGASFADPDGNDAQGTAYVFTRDGETWNEEAKLLASDGVADDRFGTAVAVEGETALIGATQAQIDGNAFQGAAYVFTRDSSAAQGVTWTEQAKLTANDGGSGDTFGTSTALTGDTALVGALFADDAQGAAYVFERAGGTWPQQHKLTADDGLPGDQFGSALAVDGDTAVIAAPIADVEGNENQGALYVFTLGAGGPAIIPVDDGVVEVADDGQCSLIEAFENAVDGGATHGDCVPGSPAGNTIVLWEESTYTLTQVYGDAQGPTGLPSVTGQILVQGNGAVIERSPAAPPFRPLHVAPSSELSLQELTVLNGSLVTPDLSGAGIRNDGTLIVSQATLSGNGGAGSGGAIYNADGAMLTVSHSTLSAGSGGGVGSGLHNATGGTAIVTYSTLSANTCGGGGCGIQNEGSLTVTNSTLSGNGGPFGGGIHNLGTMTLSHVTMALSGGGQGGLLNSGEATLRNTLIANTPSSQFDCSGAPPTFEGVNVIKDGTCECTAPTCLTGDPMVEPLGDNGGPTQTHALPGGSLAMDAADEGLCLGDDQRGVARPQGDGCDIGAYEAEVAGQPELAFDPSSLDFDDVEVGTTSPPQVATLDNTGGADATGLSFGTPGDGFDADTSDCGTSLPAGASCDVSVTFTPAGPGAASATLEVGSNEGASAGLELAGNGVETAQPIADIAPDSFAFELEAGGSDTQILTVGNVGGADLVWSIEEAESGSAIASSAPATAVSLDGDERAAEMFDASRHLDDYGHRASGVTMRPRAVAGSGSTAAGGDASWSLLGPPGGDVFDVAASTVDSDIVFAGVAPNGISGGTLYRSTDGGSTWSEVPALDGTSVFDIELTPDGTVYIGTMDGVWESNDDGLTWTAHDLGIGVNDQVFEVAIDPSDPAILWAAIADATGQQPVNLMRSTDGGATWIDRTPPLAQPMSGQGVAVDPNDSDVAIAVFGGAFGGGHVWVTTDGGASWTNRSAGLPANPMRDVVYDGARLLVAGGQLFGTQNVGIYQSDDLGATWTALHDASWPNLVAYGIAVDPNDANTILVATDGTGVHRTTDGGATWQIGIGGTGALAGRSLRFAPGSSNVLFLGTSSLAVFRSTDGGGTFAASSDGISELDLWSIHANPLAPEEIAVAFQGQNDGGVISSQDGGETWTIEPIPATRYDTVRFAPDGTLYALSTGPSSVAPEGLYRREGDGTWTELGPDQGDLFESNLTAIRFSVNDPDLILLGGRDSGTVQGNEGTIWRSTNAGQTWEKVHDAGELQPVTDIEIVEDGLDEVMIASHNDVSGGQVGGLLRSVDGGVSWSPSGSGLPTDFLRDPRLCASPGDPQVFFLSAWRSFGSGELFTTGDGGATWASTGWTTDALVFDIACDPADDQVLYVTRGSGDGVVRSQDQGASFSPFADGLGSVPSPRALAFTGDSRLLLATGKGSFVTDLEGGGGACASPSDVPWLSASPNAGVTAPDTSTPVSVTADAADLEAGNYTAQLCVTTNDPDAPLVAVPVTLTVTGGGIAELTFDPASLDFGEVPVGETSPPQSATLHNSGDLDVTGILFGDLDSGFDADTGACGDTLPVGGSCPVSVTFTPVAPGPAAATLMVNSDQGAATSLDLSGFGTATGAGFTPMALQVDPGEMVSDGNGVFEPEELVEVAPAWRNDDVAPQSLSGSAANFGGPDGANYTLNTDEADYGILDPGQTVSCLDTGLCYVLGVNDPVVRPATHWEAAFEETLSDDTVKTWTLHIGDSFVDVPPSNLFYASVETLLHSGVTGGCTGTEYCPTAANTRDQMPVFVLRAVEGADYEPPACVEGAEVFHDVSAGNVFCPWIEEVANRGVVSGCGGDNYCPNAPVTRAQMSIFLLRSLEGSDYEPPACTGQFVDVPCPSLFADWIEDLFAREITGGCSNQPLRYCPANPVNREQMAAFIGKAFALTLYGP